MSLMHFTRASIIDRLNQNNPEIHIDGIQVTVLNPQAITPDPLTGSKNSYIKVVANPAPDGFYAGHLDCYYDRENLATIGALLGGIIRMPETALDVRTTLSYLQANHGIIIDPSEVHNYPVDRTDPNNVTVELIAKPEAISVYGEVTLSVKVGVASLKADFNKFDMDGIKTLPPVNGGRAETFSYPVDFTNSRDVLSVIDAESDLTALHGIIGTATATQWTIESSPFTLIDATFISNTPTADVPVSNPAYSHVLVIEMGTEATDLTGLLYLHYNANPVVINPTEVNV